MSKAIGIIEGIGYIQAIRALDIIANYGALELLYMERNLGNLLVSVVVEGSLSEVRIAIQALSEHLPGDGMTTACIGSPSEGLLRYIKEAGEKSRRIAEVAYDHG